MVDPFPRLFGERLRLLRVVEGWTQEQVAQRAGISPKHLSLIERGKRDVPMRTARDIIELGLQTTFSHVFAALDPIPAGRYLLTESALARIPDDRRSAVLDFVRQLIQFAQ